MQFTLKRLLLSITLIAVGICGATVPQQLSNEAFANLPALRQGVVLVFFWSCGAFICGGIGCVFNRTTVGFAVGCMLLLLAMLIG